MAEPSLKDHPERTDVLFWFYFIIYSLGENLHINLILARDTHFLMKVFILISDINSILLYIIMGC